MDFIDIVATSSSKLKPHHIQSFKNVAVKENTKIDYNNKDTINFILLKNFLLKYILLIFNSYLLK